MGGLLSVGWALWLGTLPAQGLEDTLSIRVLTRTEATRAALDAVPAQCDGKPLAKRRWKLQARKNRIKAGKKTSCRVFEVQGPVTLQAGRHNRRYRGRLRIEAHNGRLKFYNQISIEEYLLGVLGPEAKAGQKETMKVQAVVSRTYALASRGRHKKHGYDLCDLPHCQVYHGTHAERDDVTQALRETEGEVLLTSTGKLAAAYFHASCGGATSAPEDVFGGKSDAVGVSDTEGDTILCETVAKDAWSYRIKKDLLAEALGVAPSPPTLKVLEKDAAGRVLKLSAFGVTFRADTFLSYVGQARGFHHLKSAFFQVSSRGNEFLFRGRGRGHGVGLCQHGAFARAKRGDSYQKILKHYFPRQTLQKLQTNESNKLLGR